MRSLQKYQRLDVAKKIEYTKLLHWSPALDENKEEKEGKPGHMPVCETVVESKDVEKLRCVCEKGGKEEGSRVFLKNCMFMIRENFDIE